jgi:hypothetical protein
LKAVRTKRRLGAIPAFSIAPKNDFTRFPLYYLILKNPASSIPYYQTRSLANPMMARNFNDGLFGTVQTICYRLLH